MIKASNLKLLHTLIVLLTLGAVAKLLSLVLSLYLPDKSIELSLSENYKPKYQRVSFDNMLNVPSTQKKNDESVKTPSGIEISNMLLKGLYGDKKSGFAIVALKSTPEKTTIISVGESFSGYELIEILSDGVMFRKNSQNYLLNMKKVEFNDSYVTPVSSNVDNTQTEDVMKNVSKSDLSFYLDDPKRIWRDISIIEVKKGNKIEGFKITSIKAGSKMAKLGLKNGDVIIRANNIELNSYKDAFSIFNDINNITEMQVVVLRNNKEKEFVYEIN